MNQHNRTSNDLIIQTVRYGYIKRKNYETYCRSARVQFTYKFWTILNDLEVFGTLSNNFLGPSLSILVNLSKSGSILLYLALSWAILVFLRLCRKIPGYLWLYLTISGYLPTSDCLGLSRVIPGYIQLSRFILSYFWDLSYNLWLYLAISSYF